MTYDSVILYVYKMYTIRKKFTDKINRCALILHGSPGVARKQWDSGGYHVAVQLRIETCVQETREIRHNVVLKSCTFTKLCYHALFQSYSRETQIQPVFED